MNEFEKWWCQEYPRCPENEPTKKIALEAWNAALDATADKLTNNPNTRDFMPLIRMYLAGLAARISI